MHGYIAFSHNSKRAEIFAESLAEASTKARELFKPPKSKAFMVHVKLAELNVVLDADGKYVSGTPVTHTAVD